MISSLPKWIINLFGNSMQPNVKVLEIAYINAQIKKIRFQGDISKWDFQIGYASVVRVSETEFRNYTVAYHDTENEIFDFVLHIHGNGVGSQYLDNLKENDELFISPPRGKKLYDPKVKQQFFFGDETSLGVAFALLPLLKKNNHQFQFYFELDEENRNVPESLGLKNYFVYPKDGSFRDDDWVRNLIATQLPKDKDEANFILTGNVKSVQAFKRVLKNWDIGKINFQGYWLEGKKGL